MAEYTKISYCDATANAWWSCSRVHVGCTSCYAEQLAGRFGIPWGPSAPRRYMPGWRKVLARVARRAVREDRNLKVFLNDMSDLFDDHEGEVVDAKKQRLWIRGSQIEPESGDFTENALQTNRFEPLRIANLRQQVFAEVDRYADRLTFLMLTKRPQNVRRMWPTRPGPGYVSHASSERRLGNVWLLYSASDQSTLNAGVPHLLECRDLVPVLGLSLEPLIGPVDLSGFFGYNPNYEINRTDRNVCLRSREVGSAGDQGRRNDMASSRTKEDADCKETASDVQIPNCKGDAGREAGNYVSSEARLSSLQGPDSSGINRQSYRRKHPEQPPSQPGTSDVCGASEARQDHVGPQVEGRQTERRIERHGEVDRIGCQGDQAAKVGRGVTEVDSSGLWDLGSNSVQDSTWGQLVARPFVIVGGESGPRHRPMEIAWLESIAEQCAAAGVPLYVKQDSGPKPGQQGCIPDQLWATKEFPRCENAKPQS